MKIAEALLKIASDDRPPTVEETRDAVRRLKRINESDPSLGHKLRYAGLGAVAAPLVAAATGAIAGKPSLTGSLGQKARQLAAQSVGGATMFGAIPILRGQIDRQMERGKIEDFLEGHKKTYVTPKGNIRKLEGGRAELFRSLAAKYPGAIEPEKVAKVLTMKGRKRIKEKNFAIPSENGPGGTGRYPIHDATHARAAIQMVGKHGTPEEKARVHAAVAKKYPGLAQRSTVIEKAAMTAELLKIAADVLSGGKADDKSSSDFSAKQMAMGKKVEMEHTNSPELAKEISRDHLEEFPDYYTRLHKMEAEAEKAKEKTSSWGAMTSALAKLADGDEDEGGGEESGRAPTSEDKDAIRKFLAARPQGTEDEEYHEFLEARGVRVPLGEAYAYDLAKKGLNKSASGCVIDFDNDGNRMGVEWHKDALARIMNLPKESGAVKAAAMKEAFKRSYYHGTGPWGPTFMKTDKMPDPSRVAQSQMPAQQAIENMSGKVAGAAITPAARLATSMQVGRPPAALSKVGPSVAQVGKIKGPGSGTALPGAKEGGSV